MTNEPPNLSAPPGTTFQLRLFQILTIVLAVLLLGGAAFYFYRMHMAQPVAIVVNGVPEVTMQSMQDAETALVNYKSSLVAAPYLKDDAPLFTETVQLRRAPNAVDIDTPESAQSKLSSLLHLTVMADEITVDHMPIVALPDRDTAQATVDALRLHYVNMTPPGQLYAKPSFREDVEITRKRVPSTLTKAGPDDAAPLLWTAPPATPYTVQRGETGWSIAHKVHLSFTDFLRANSGHDINHLAPGDIVNISKTFPPVTVVVQKLQQVQETFGGTGRRLVTLDVTYINGEQQGAPVAVNFTTTQRATPVASLQ